MWVFSPTKTVVSFFMFKDGKPFNIKIQAFHNNLKPDLSFNKGIITVTTVICTAILFNNCLYTPEFAGVLF